MEFLIKRKNIPSQFIDLELALLCTKGVAVQLQLPSWRPGRYELANYAQKLRDLKVSCKEDELVLHKVTKDLWYFTPRYSGLHILQYEYHASQMDAGGSWSDDEQLYLNFINFTFQILGREDEEIIIKLNLPDDYKIATALPSTTPFELKAKGFQHLVDSPLIASPTLSHHQYKIGDSTFFLWFQGAVHFDVQQFIAHFIAFTEKQIMAFGDFPASAYHFLFQLLPYKHYHGVEHQFSTVITFGPAKDLENKSGMDMLVGVSSHELYHFWNVCRIRPKGLLPYDFSKETYLNSGVVLEGVTTYMGDLFLLKSGYLTLEDYFRKLEKWINREFEQFGWKHQSISESSFDLWLDGYKIGIPDRKVSIYNRGALISLCLDLLLMDGGSSLHHVMKMVWISFGKKEIGYSLQDFQRIVGQLLNDQKASDQFFRQYICGKEDIFPLLQSQLNSLGIALLENKRNEMESCYGLVIDKEGSIQSIHPDSPAYHQLMIGDVVSPIEIPQITPEFLKISVTRNSRLLAFTLEKKGRIYYKNFILRKDLLTEKFIQWRA